jgi:DNA-binding MurR/RpiR family transcriptional regulator
MQAIEPVVGVAPTGRNLERLEERIKAQYSALTKKQKEISRFIIENMEEAAFLSLSKLAHLARVSEASVTRFCLVLGYNGYGELQDDLQSWIKSRITPLIKISKSIPGEEEENAYTKVIDSDLANLESLRNRVPEAQLDQAVKDIVDAEKVYVIGLRSSFAPAYLLAHYLNHIGVSSELLDMQGGRLLDKAIHIGPGNVVVAISFPRYFKDTVEILQYARSRKCRTIVITDSVLSPAAQCGDTVITAKYNTPIPFLSYASVLTLINCLVFGVATRRRQRTVTTVAEMERMMEQWGSCIALDHPPPAQGDAKGRASIP